MAMTTPMEVSKWREQAPHGAYFQAIHLTLESAETTEHSVGSSNPDGADDAAAAAPETPAIDSTNGAEETAPLASGSSIAMRSTGPKQAEEAASIEAANASNTLLIPPFEGVSLGSERIVLNVGGPVWAMDWFQSTNSITSTANVQDKENLGLGGKDTTYDQIDDAARNYSSNGVQKPAQETLVSWRLLALSTHPPCQVVDGKVVKNTPPDHYYDAPEGGRNLIQIWAIPVVSKALTRDKNSSTHQMKPRIVFAIDHSSGVAWDLQWCPKSSKMPRGRVGGGNGSNASGVNGYEQALGVLAVCFGDGSLQIFCVPSLAADKLEAEPKTDVVEQLQPVVRGQVDEAIQLSVQWSPHNWSQLLTGGSDGSVALWNIDSVWPSHKNVTEPQESLELEPQRRFQDADTIGKQESFDWGWGWVAIRAVSWSPFDENLFATTGNDSLFKVWDIREPRICLRSHRIRSTWGLSLQWMDDSSIQISGDQGSIFMYDILSGSYQKLHFHPQIDSPVWDLQFARRGKLPLLISACTSGCVRLAPAKKLYRSPQQSVEVCRLRGDRNATVELPHKSLSLSFDARVVMGSAESVSPATREFSERDASLHRLRLSTNLPHEQPCFVATGGHAGLVIIMEMQEQFDQFLETHFMPSTKKIGRPRKTQKNTMPGAWSVKPNVFGHSKSKLKTPAPPKSKRATKGTNLSSFAKAKRMHSSIAKHKVHVKKNAIIVEASTPEPESTSEPEYQENGEESESESEELSLPEDNSDDDRVVASNEDDSLDDETSAITPPETPEQARLRSEYQLDLSEEDAIRLAIQMSEMEPLSIKQEPVDASSKTPTQKSSKKPTKSKSKLKKPRVSKGPAKAPKKMAAITPQNTEDATIRLPEIESHLPSKDMISPTRSSAPASDNRVEQHNSVAAKPQTPPTEKKTPRKRVLASRQTTSKQTTPPAMVNNNTTTATPRRCQEKSLREGTASSPSKLRGTPDRDDVDSQKLDEASKQLLIYQKGMSEEDALREAIRLSELGHRRRSTRERKSPATDERNTSITRPAASPRKRGSPATDAIVKSEPSPRDYVTRKLSFDKTVQSEAQALIDSMGTPDADATSLSPAKSIKPAMKSSRGHTSPGKATKAKTKRETTKTPSAVAKTATKRRSPKKRAPSQVSSRQEEADVSVVLEKDGGVEVATVTSPSPDERKSVAKRERSTTQIAENGSYDATETASAKKRAKTKSSSSNNSARTTGSANRHRLLSEEELFEIALKTSQIEY